MFDNIPNWALVGGVGVIAVLFLMGGHHGR
jgi:hypothetical protein